MEASALQAPATLAQPRVSIPAPLLRLRSDEQLVSLFRAGHDEAFRAIHDRYHKRLFAYARQMLPGRQDAEDALQDVFVRAYSGLRASDRDLALRAWLFRVAHNRCIDELRRPAPPPPEVLQLVRSVVHDPVAEADVRESLRRLIDDVRRLPDQQRSALLLRELGGMSYAELAASLGISVGAVKSLLVRARIALAQAAAARDTACSEIHEELVEAYERGIRPNANARRHMRDCAGCRGFRRDLRGVNRRLAALGPAVGPLGLLTKLLGLTGGAGGGATASSATAGGATAGGATAGGAALVGGAGVAAGTGGAFLGAGHVATLIAAAVATAGGAVELQHTITAPAPRAPAHVRVAKHAHRYVAPPVATAPARSYVPGTDFASPTETPAQPAASDATTSKIAALERAKRLIKSELHTAGPNGTGGGALIGPPKSSTSTTSSTTGTGLTTTGSLVGDGTSTGTGDPSGSSSTSSGTAGSTTSGSSTSGSSSTGGSSAGSTSGTGSPTAGSGGSSSSTSGTNSSGTSTTSSSASSSSSGSSTSSTDGGFPVPPK